MIIMFTTIIRSCAGLHSAGTIILNGSEMVESLLCQTSAREAGENNWKTKTGAIPVY